MQQNRTDNFLSHVPTAQDLESVLVVNGDKVQQISKADLISHLGTSGGGGGGTIIEGEVLVVGNNTIEGEILEI